MKRTKVPSQRAARFTYHRTLIQLWAAVLCLFSFIKLLHITDEAWAPCKRLYCLALGFYLLRAASKHDHQRVRLLFICFFFTQMGLNMQFLRNMKPKALPLHLLLDFVVNLWVVFPQLVLIDMPAPQLVLFECAQVTSSTLFNVQDLGHPPLFAVCSALATHALVFLAYAAVERQVQASYAERLRIAAEAHAHTDQSEAPLKAMPAMPGTQKENAHAEDTEPPPKNASTIPSLSTTCVSIRPCNTTIKPDIDRVSNTTIKPVLEVVALRQHTPSAFAPDIKEDVLVPPSESSREQQQLQQSEGRPTADTLQDTEIAAAVAAAFPQSTRARKIPADPHCSPPVCDLSEALTSGREAESAAAAPQLSVAVHTTDSCSIRGGPTSSSSSSNGPHRHLSPPHPFADSRALSRWSSMGSMDGMMGSTRAPIATPSTAYNSSCHNSNRGADEGGMSWWHESLAHETGPLERPPPGDGKLDVQHAMRLARALAERAPSYKSRLSNRCRVSIRIQSQDASQSVISDDGLSRLGDLLRNRIPHALSVAKPAVRHVSPLTPMPTRQACQSTPSEALVGMPSTHSPQSHHQQQQLQQQQQPQQQQQQLLQKRPSQQLRRWNQQQHPQLVKQKRSHGLKQLQTATIAARLADRTWLTATAAAQGPARAQGCMQGHSALLQGTTMAVQIHNSLQQFGWSDTLRTWLPLGMHQPIHSRAHSIHAKRSVLLLKSMDGLGQQQQQQQAAQHQLLKSTEQLQQQQQQQQLQPAQHELLEGAEAQGQQQHHYQLAHLERLKSVEGQEQQPAHHELLSKKSRRAQGQRQQAARQDQASMVFHVGQSGAQFWLLQQQQQQQQQQHQQQQRREQQGNPFGNGNTQLLDLDVCMRQGEVLEGSRTSPSDVNLQPNTLVCTASLNGRHLPTRIATVSPLQQGSDSNVRKFLVQVALEVLMEGVVQDPPLLLVLDLKCGHAVVAPSCPVVLLPPIMSHRLQELVSLLDQ